MAKRRTRRLPTRRRGPIAVRQKRPKAAPRLSLGQVASLAAVAGGGAAVAVGAIQRGIAAAKAPGALLGAFLKGGKEASLDAAAAAAGLRVADLEKLVATLKTPSQVEAEVRKQLSKLGKLAKAAGKRAAGIPLEAREFGPFGMVIDPELLAAGLPQDTMTAVTSSWVLAVGTFSGLLAVQFKPSTKHPAGFRCFYLHHPASEAELMLGSGSKGRYVWDHLYFDDYWPF